GPAAAAPVAPGGPVATALPRLRGVRGGPLLRRPGGGQPFRTGHALRLRRRLRRPARHQAPGRVGRQRPADQALGEPAAKVPRVALVPRRSPAHRPRWARSMTSESRRAVAFALAKRPGVRVLAPALECAAAEDRRCIGEKECGETDPKTAGAPLRLPELAPEAAVVHQPAPAGAAAVAAMEAAQALLPSVGPDRAGAQGSGRGAPPQV